LESHRPLSQREQHPPPRKLSFAGHGDSSGPLGLVSRVDQCARPYLMSRCALQLTFDCGDFGHELPIATAALGAFDARRLLASPSLYRSARISSSLECTLALR